MTCIIGIKDKELHRVVIGGDNAASAGSSYNLRKDPKVFKNQFPQMLSTKLYKCI